MRFFPISKFFERSTENGIAMRKLCTINQNVVRSVYLKIYKRTYVKGEIFVRSTLFMNFCALYERMDTFYNDVIDGV